MKYDIHEFDEIRPYEPEEMKQAFEDLLNDRQFNVLMKGFADRKSTRLNSSHIATSRMPSSA